MRYINLIMFAAVGASACAREEHPIEAASQAVAGTNYTIIEKPTIELVRASAIAEPYASATLSTKLMGTVVAVHVREGDHVRAGQPLVSIDARDLSARDAQIEAGIAEAEAVRQDALKNTQRMRALHAEEAATRAQLDGAETSLLRAEAAVRTARAAREELKATRGYAVVRAPFTGVIISRMVDPGAFAAPGAPLISIQDARKLRLVGTAPPGAIRNVMRNASIDAEVEGNLVRGVVEATVPAGGNLYRVNVIVDNRASGLLPGSAAAIFLPQSERMAIRIPLAAIRRSGDLTGVYVKNGSATTLRWLQLGAVSKGEVEVLAGLRTGESIVIPVVSAGAQ